MKKTISLILTFLMVAMSFVLMISAGESPLAEKELTQPEELPASDRLITNGLTVSGAYSESPWKENELTEAQKTDLAQITYGFSMIGVSKLERTVLGAVDGVWTKGNYKVNGELGNGSGIEGALSYYPDGNLYNVNGETKKSDSVYEAIMTFNFGKKMFIDALAFVTSNKNHLNGIPQAADLYVSDDGENWTLIGGYDRNAKRAEGKDYTLFTSKGLGSDMIDNDNKQAVGIFNIATSGQYLRVACTTGNGLASIGDDGSWSNPITSSCAMREVLVWGEEYKAPELLYGAAVRLSSPTGLRFESTISYDDVAALTAKYGAENVKFGTVICPTDYIGTDGIFTKEALSAAGKTFLDIKQTVWKETATKSGENYKFSAVISNIKTENYERAFSAISYVEITDGTNVRTIYAEYDETENSRTVKDVAQAAIDEGLLYTDDELAILNGFTGALNP